jgi:hypothetical protein
MQRGAIFINLCAKWNLSGCTRVICVIRGNEVDGSERKDISKYFADILHGNSSRNTNLFIFSFFLDQCQVYLKEIIIVIQLSDVRLCWIEFSKSMCEWRNSGSFLYFSDWRSIKLATLLAAEAASMHNKILNILKYNGE